MKIELSSQRRKKSFVLVVQHGRFDVRCNPAIERYCLVRVILIILITIVPNKIFSYGLKQTVLETTHILMKTLYKFTKSSGIPGVYADHILFLNLSSTV